MKKDDDIEDLFKKKFEDFEADVKPEVWKNIRTALKGFGVGFFIKMLLNKIGTSTLIAVTSSLVTIVTTVMVMNWSGSKKTETTENKPTTVEATTEKVAPVVANNTLENNVVSNKEEQSSGATSPIVQNESAEAKEPVKTSIKKDQKEIESVINKYSKKPIADIFASPISVTVATPVSLMNNGTGRLNKWTFGDSKQVETETSPVHYYSEPGVYTVKLTSTNADGKIAVDSVKIEVMGSSIPSSSIPTDFSPNGDKNLDEFVFKIGDNMEYHSAVVFNNKGIPVFEKEGKENFIWDGKDKKGQNVKEGLYFYIYNSYGVDGKKYERTGSINLTR